MEKIKKIGEIICNDGEFTDYMYELLEKTNFVVRCRIKSSFDTVYEIYKKID